VTATSDARPAPGGVAVTFDNDRGHRLAGIYDAPAREPLAVALFAHCFTCSKRTKATARVSRSLTSHGMAVLRFDFTGLGESEGDFAEETFTSSVADLLAAADWLRHHHRAPALLIGHSLGGAAVLAAAGGIPECRAVATIAAPADTDHAEALFGDALAQITRDGRARVRLGGQTLTIGRDLVDDLAAQPQRDRIASLGRALLIMHSPLDETVGIDNAAMIYNAARHPKSFVSLDGASHLLDEERDARYAAQVIAAWASRYVPMTDEPMPEAPVEGPAAATMGETRPAGAVDVLEPGVVLVTESGEGRFGQLLRAGRHHWRADEPQSVPGATDTGPSPYDHVLAGLGACTSMTIRMYAQRKGWPVTAISVKLRQDRVHAEDCESTTQDALPTRLLESAAAGPTSTMDVIVREVSIEGDLDEAQLARLLEIAERCPVHRTLESGIRIITRGV